MPYLRKTRFLSCTPIGPQCILPLWKHLDLRGLYMQIQTSCNLLGFLWNPLALLKGIHNIFLVYCRWALLRQVQGHFNCLLRPPPSPAIDRNVKKYKALPPCWKVPPGHCRSPPLNLTGDNLQCPGPSTIITKKWIPLRCTLKPPDLRNVSKASSVKPNWKPLGQGSSLAPLMTTFDTWLHPAHP